MNLLLLSPDNFCHEFATITNVGQLTHIRTVLKSQIGDWLKIGQMDGNIGVGQICEISDHAIVLKNICLDKSPPQKLALTVILALPRPKVMRRLIMDMTAIGVERIILINSYSSEKSYWQSPLVADDKLMAYAFEGLQQGMDTVLPTITKAKRFKPFVEDSLPMLVGQKWVAHPYANSSFKHELAKHGLPNVLMVGAEGGFTAYEIGLLQDCGVQAVSMGERILRTESAMNALLGAWL